jgi:hypothetical protein
MTVIQIIFDPTPEMITGQITLSKKLNDFIVSRHTYRSPQK